MEWILQNQNAEKMTSHEGPKALSLWPRALRELLIRRGFTSDEALTEFLDTNVQTLKDPFSLKNMNEACVRIAQAFEKNETVCIYADFDLDGTSGCALLKKGLEQLGFQRLIPYQPRRLKDGYGFHAHVVEDLQKQGVNLIVTCDVGITANKAADRAKELGMDVIITDHHLPSDVLPAAVAVVNPNQPGDTSGLGYLSGAGVAFTLMRALKRSFTDRKLGTPEKLNLQGLLDCFTVATLTDMVPIIEDNRVLVKMGLKELARTQRPGLRALLEVLNLSNKSLTSSDVAIRFAPKLNALSRLEGEILPLDLYLIEDYARAELLVSQVLLQNQERVSLQAEALSAAQEQAAQQADLPCLFVYSENFHRGVIGLIATSLSQEFNKPSFVASLDPEEGKLVGSCRLPDSSDYSLVEALGKVGEHLLRFGGHAKAAGFETVKENIKSVTTGLVDFFQSTEKLPQKLVFDAHLTLKEFNFELMKYLDLLQPFGVGFELPLFCMQNIKILSQKNLKGGHLKFELGQNGESRGAVLFGPSTRHRELLKATDSVDIVAQLQVHEWKGSKSLQILIEDIRAAQEMNS